MMTTFTKESRATPLPSIFVSHGSPMMAVESSPTHSFLSNMSDNLPVPKAIIVFSAHFDMSDEIVICSAEQPKTIHDFYGFPKGLYDLNYPAPGEPELAQKVAALLAKQGIKSRLDATQGWDHGVWIPMSLMFPKADIPIVQISVNSRLSAEAHYRLGQSVRVLREQGVLIVGSGGISHNLRELFAAHPDPDGANKVKLFTDWIYNNLKKGDVNSLLNYLHDAPHALFNHPTAEHFLPFFCFLGSCSDVTAIKRIHQQVEHKLLALDAYMQE